MASNSIKLSLCPESAAALREFAKAMPVAVNNLAESCEKLKRAYDTASESLGIHREDFFKMISILDKMQEQAANSIQVLPQMLESTAAKIDQYVAAHPKV